ncbi:hypothetical protein EYF80_040970 [Liparis tanakae]|uniref:Uncharacterized protein n=1 Tax=Liparis tanakae TaxID=230148 RepID=A0A4Z2G5J2_9TELE|nr:hypothetical protein EYF80_040970 [Liparis tanakae]
MLYYILQMKDGQHLREIGSQPPASLCVSRIHLHSTSLLIRGVFGCGKFRNSRGFLRASSSIRSVVTLSEDRYGSDAKLSSWQGEKMMPLCTERSTYCRSLNCSPLLTDISFGMHSQSSLSQPTSEQPRQSVNVTLAVSR